MKLHELDRTSLENNSFSIKRNRYPHFLKVWHYHQELELVLILRSSGTRFVGDSIGKFKPGEVVLIGKSLPHMWLNDEEYFDKSLGKEAEAIAIHFKEEFLGPQFIQAPEMKDILTLLDRAKQGIHFVKVQHSVLKKIENLIPLKGFERTLSFIKILNSLACHKNFELLASEGYVSSFNETQIKSANKIYEYIFQHFQENISSRDIAKIANMNPSAFSRFFRRTHRKTFTRYLNELRIGFACKLLIERAGNITEVCYEAGFSSKSNFNKQFKLITDMSPTEYARLHT